MAQSRSAGTPALLVFHDIRRGSMTPDSCRKQKGERHVADFVNGICTFLLSGWPRLQDEAGQDMIEYALLGALISVVAILVILAVGPFLDNFFTLVLNAFQKT